MPRVSNLARVARKKTRRRTSTSSGSGVTPVKAAITAAVIGMAEKSGVLDKLPEIPIVGRKGALAIGAYIWARHGGGSLARDVCLVAASICGYQWGKEGSISGE